MFTAHDISVDYADHGIGMMVYCGSTVLANMLRKMSRCFKGAQPTL
jgi:hypothetical protein